MREARPTKQSLDKAQVTPADVPSAYERSLIEASLDPLGSSYRFRFRKVDP